jgi:hypothetical protein
MEDNIAFGSEKAAIFWPKRNFQPTINESI